MNFCRPQCFMLSLYLQTLNANWTNICSRCPTVSTARCSSQAKTRLSGKPAPWKTPGMSCPLELSGRDINTHFSYLTV